MLYIYIYVYIYIYTLNVFLKELTVRIYLRLFEYSWNV